MHGRLLRLSIVGSVATALDLLVHCGCLCFWSIRPAASVIVLQIDPFSSCLLGSPAICLLVLLLRDQTARTVPGVLVLRVDSPIYFANSGYLREGITRWIDDDDEQTSAKGETGVQYVVLDMGAVSSIDTSRTSMLDGLKKTLDRRAIQRSAASTLAGRACWTSSRRPCPGELFSIDTSRTSMLDELKKTLDRRAIQIVLANPRSEIMKKLDSSKIWSGNAQSMYHKMMVLL